MLTIKKIVVKKTKNVLTGYLICDISDMGRQQNRKT